MARTPPRSAPWPEPLAVPHDAERPFHFLSAGFGNDRRTVANGHFPPDSATHGAKRQWPVRASLRKARDKHMFSALVPIVHVCRDDEPTLIEPVGDDAIAER
jgi:hypothetical protein